jgi:hypothetical protein
MVTTAAHALAIRPRLGRWTTEAPHESQLTVDQRVELLNIQRPRLERLAAAADTEDMRTLRWVAAGFLLLVLTLGIGLVAAFVFEATSIVGVAVGASMAVLAWRGLRSIEPRHPEDRPPEGWPVALLGTAVYIAVLVLTLWNPWLLVFAILVFPLWWRLTRARRP